MGVTTTVPADTKTPGSAGHTSDHNLISNALTALSTAVHDTITEFGAGVLLDTAAPATPASGKSVVYSSANGVAQAKMDSGLAGSLPVSQTDLTTFTVTAAANTQFSKLWAIPANDANAGTLYRLTLWAAGTQGSTQETITVSPMLDAVAAVGGNRPTIPSTLVAISTAFNIRVIYELQVLTTGAGGTANIYITTEVTQNTGTPTTAQTMVNTAANPASAIDTTAAHTMSLDMAWGATTGLPTVTSRGSLFERLGA